jgi:EAL domain-containing protein (putative c-di-GMP-specific phosphodiesterase class I)
MPNKFRSLVASGDDDFREELIERAVGLNFSVKAIRRADELPLLLSTDDFDWLILDVGLGESECSQIIAGLADSRVPPRAILVGSSDRAAFDPIRRIADRASLDVVGMLARPLSFEALGKLLVDLPAREGEAADRELASLELDTIPSNEIVVHYQPIVALQNRTISGFEALVRWQHPRLGLIRPGRFISLAARSGAIIPMTWEVLRRAVDQQVAWHGDGIPLFISVNVSALFLESLQTADNILTLLKCRDCDPRHLTVEITETEAARNPPTARAVLVRLREAGVEVSMDDYGVGFSNLERLRYFPFSDLKVDRWLVASLGSSGRARETIEMLVALAGREKFSLTGEGIETQQQWDALEELGCDFGQGFLIARPMPASQVEGWIGRVNKAGRYRAPQPA